MNAGLMCPPSALCVVICGPLAVSVEPAVEVTMLVVVMDMAVCVWGCWCWWSRGCGWAAVCALASDAVLTTTGRSLSCCLSSVGQEGGGCGASPSGIWVFTSTFGAESSGCFGAPSSSSGMGPYSTGRGVVTTSGS